MRCDTLGVGNLMWWERLTYLPPDAPVRVRKMCLVVVFGMFYGLMTGMGVGMMLVRADVATAKTYFLVSMGIAGILAAAGALRVVWTAASEDLLALVWRFAAGWAGAIVPVLITMVFMARHIRYGFLIGAIAGLILTVGLLRTLPESD